MYLFAVTGNPKVLIGCLSSVKGVPEKTNLVNALRSFYEMIICCKISTLDNVVKDLRSAIHDISIANINYLNPKYIVFSEIIREIVYAKMAFINESEYLVPLVYWCLHNDYIQQGVTIIWEKILKDTTFCCDNIEYRDCEKVRRFRNGFNHADGREINATVDNIKAFLIDHILKKL